MFQNKTVLITGASQGIGRVIALKFASLGAKTALNDIAAQEENLKILKKEIEDKKGLAEYFLADVSKIQEVEKMMQDIQVKLGGLDILVNNAGITKDRTLVKMTSEEWQKVIDVNLTGVFNCSKSCLPLIVPNQGNIVSIASIVGLRGNFGQTNYAASKAGIIAFTKSLAKEVGKTGVRINAVAPGFIETKMAEAIPEQLKATVKQLTALGRFGKPEEVAEAVVFLASPEAGFITGAVLSIDGGLSL